MAGELQGERQVLNVLKNIEAAGQDTAPAMEGVASAIHARVMAGFRAGTSPDGASWAPLKVRSGQPLRDNGILQRSITPSHSATEAQVGVGGAAQKYAPVHQFGATIKAKNHPYLVFPVGGGAYAKVKSVEIPARPFLPIDDAGNTQLPLAWAQDVENRVLRHYQLAVGG